MPLGAHTAAGKGGGMKPRSQCSALEHGIGNIYAFVPYPLHTDMVLGGTAKELAVAVCYQWLLGVWTPLLSPSGLRLRC